VARILQVCNTDFFLTKFVAPLVRVLTARGHKVDCVCEGAHQVDPESLGPGVRVFEFSFPRESSPWQFARAIQRMRLLIREGQYDCVDGQNRNGSIVARVAARLEGVPVNLYTANGYYFHDDQNPIAYGATVLLEGALARLTDYTLSQSTEDLKLMTRLHFVPPSRIEAIGNGIETDRFVPRKAEREELEQSLGLRSRRFRIASTGRLVAGKGFGDLLEAFALLHHTHPDTELLLIGGNIAQDISPFQAQFLARLKELDLEQAVCVTGLTDEVERYLATSDVFVLASYREGLPRALLEAMSCELAVAATDIRGCREEIVEGTGFLFPAHDIDALHQILTRYYQNEALRANVGKAARERACALFSEPAYLERQADTIDRLVGRLC
jgi:glycosyltransferase involved in cell wall biosynthesis